jgi:hypothetical protein
MKSGQVFLLIKKCNTATTKYPKADSKTFSYQLLVSGDWQPATIIFASLVETYR